MLQWRQFPSSFTTYEFVQVALAMTDSNGVRITILLYNNLSGKSRSVWRCFFFLRDFLSIDEVCRCSSETWKIVGIRIVP